MLHPATPRMIIGVIKSWSNKYHP